MDKLEQVFVSSTYTDLREERQAVIEMLLKADCLPAGMEFFPAADDEKFELIKQVIDRSDYYVVIIGGRYGSVDASGVSFTEREYDYAVESGTPVMSFVHANPDEIPVGATDKDSDALQKLLDFRSKVETRMCARYSSPAELAGQVAASLISIRKTQPAEGWVRAGEALTPAIREEIAALRQQVSELRVQLDAAESTPPVGAEGLAQGSNPHEVAVEVQTRQDRKDSDFGFGYTEPVTYSWRIKATWDQLFGAVGPLLFEEASEQAMKAAIDGLCNGAFEEAAFTKAAKMNSGRVTGVNVQDDAFHEIKTQLFALGLIHRSNRPRAVRDRSTYWSLTPFGEKQLISLRAIRS